MYSVRAPASSQPGYPGLQRPRPRCRGLNIAHAACPPPASASCAAARRTRRTHARFRTQDTTPLRQICARVDYLNSLQKTLPEQRAVTEEMRNEFAMLVVQCREALGSPIDENE